MNLLSLFNKRNYLYFYYKIKSYPKSVTNERLYYTQYNYLQDIIDYLEINKYQSLCVVASGPSSKNIEFKKDILYVATNDSIKIVDSESFIYVVQDLFYLTRYLKTFTNKELWKGTVFFLDNIKMNQKALKRVKDYRKSKSRSRREFLISDVDHNNNILFNEINDYLLKTINTTYQGINSGFTSVQLAFVLCLLTNKPLTIYGLDMGVGNEIYFNSKNGKLGKSISSNINRKRISNLLSKMYTSKVTVVNKSNFENNDL